MASLTQDACVILGGEAGAMYYDDADTLALARQVGGWKRPQEEKNGALHLLPTHYPTVWDVEEMTAAQWATWHGQTLTPVLWTPPRSRDTWGSDEGKLTRLLQHAEGQYQRQQAWIDGCRRRARQATAQTGRPPTPLPPAPPLPQIRQIPQTPAPKIPAVTGVALIDSALHRWAPHLCNGRVEAIQAVAFAIVVAVDGDFLEHVAAVERLSDLRARPGLPEAIRKTIDRLLP